MGYSMSQQKTPDRTAAENHEKVAIDVWTRDGKFIEQIVRTVFSDGTGKRYITYNRTQHQLKKMHRTPWKHPARGEFRELYILKVMPDEGSAIRLKRGVK